MGVEATGSESYDAGLRLAHRRKEIEETEQNLAQEKAQAKREGEKELVATREKNEENLVKISKEASAKADMLRKSQNDSYKQLNQQVQDHVENLTADTAKRIADLDAEAFKQVAAHQASAMERINLSEERSADPFYRMRALDAKWTETEKGYEIRVKVPPHEAERVFIASERNQMKVSLARSFQDELQLDDGRKNKTSSAQTIVETMSLPTRVDPSTATREYKDGYVVYHVNKLV